MASSMNPVDLYRDPSLDGLIDQNDYYVRQPSSHKRNSLQDRRQIPDQTLNDVRPPPAPEVPRGPPVSYRGGTRDDPGLQRSFSQRAKNRPFAKEAFAEDYDTPAVDQLESTEPAYDMVDRRSQGTRKLQKQAPAELKANTGSVNGRPMMTFRRTVEPPSKEKIPTQTTTKQPSRPPPDTNHNTIAGSGNVKQPPRSKPDTNHQASKPVPQHANVNQKPRPTANAAQHDKEPVPTHANVNQKPQPKVDTSSHGLKPSPTQATTHKRSISVSDEKSHGIQATPTMSKRSAMVQRSAPVDDQRRDWAPDRSPLQKLEVTLNDISKEEKRARVQEAEMLLRESKAGRNQSQNIQGTRQVSRNEPVSKRVSSRHEPASNTDVYNDEEADPVHNLSATQRQRLHHSTVIENHKPDPRQLSEGDYSGLSHDYTPGRNDIQQTAGKEERRRRMSDSSRRAAHENALSHLEPAHRAAHEKLIANAVPTNITRAVSMQNHQPQARFRDDQDEDDDQDYGYSQNEKRTPTRFVNVDSSGGSLPGSVNRSGSRKLQKPPPGENDRHKVRNGDAQFEPSQRPNDNSRARPKDYGIGTAQKSLHRPVETQDPQSHSNGPSVGLGLHGSEQPNSQYSPSEQRDPGRQRQRKSSVSFQEPVLQKPNDEWKEAGVARLSLADIELDKPAESDKSTAWWEQGKDTPSRRRSRGATTAKHSNHGPDEIIDDRNAEFEPRLYLRCGPLLRYTGMKSLAETKGHRGSGGREVWRGSVMIVTQDSRSSYEMAPTLRLFAQPKRLLPPPPAHIAAEELTPEYIDPIAGLNKLSRTGRVRYVRPVDHLDEGRDLSLIENDDGLFESSPSPADLDGSRNTTLASTNNRTEEKDGERVGKYQEVLGARLYTDSARDVTFWRFNIEVELSDTEQHIAYRINRGASTGFWVPARGQSMNIMFHSCNGFSASVNPDHFSGPDPLWRDVLNNHQTRPFHVMIGGGDQIYNDRVVLETQHFGEWVRLKNPQHKHHAQFTYEMKEELESFLLNRYAMWFSQGLFGMANSQIPMINIWDDHDIIDGFGSYPDHFMSSPVFSGYGNVAFKYYMLFQHQSVPEETTSYEPSWVLGHELGPYVHQLSRSVFMKLGKSIAFLGLDCRTERMRDEVLSVKTLDIVLERCRKEIIEGETKHLIVLLGVPIAYPRLVWLENVLTSRAMDPVKALGRAGIFKGGFLNKFDGGVEILDDLDDHWTASHHKHERNDLVKDLQDLAAEKSVRITILGGDVHLAAVGQFHSNPKLKIPKDRDHRYMPNVISSAIANTPPPDMLADILNRRNKTHHLDRYTDENMIPMFTHDVNHKRRKNKHMLPRRNWCSIREYFPGTTPPPTPPDTPSLSGSEGLENDQVSQEYPRRRFSFSKEDVNPRALLRRLSSRNGPPTSYRDTTDPSHKYRIRPASSDGLQGQNSSFDGNVNATGSQSQSINSSGLPERRASSFDHTSSGIPVRPNTFLRRPTNLSEKAAKRGNIPAVDDEGNEFDVNDHINLEGGLDIELNVEVNQRDPSGITVPYRLLVPALWYDGSSDREKLEEETGIHKRPTILNRLSFGQKRGQRVAQNQGAGNWDQDTSDVESHSGSEDMQMTQPRRRFSLFGNRRRKKEEYYPDSEEDEDDYDPEPNQQSSHQPSGRVTDQQSPNIRRDARVSGNQGPVPNSQPSNIRRDAPISSHPPYGSPRNVSAPVSNHDRLYDTQNPPPPQTRPQAGPPRRSLTISSQPQAANNQHNDDDDSIDYQYPPPPNRNNYPKQAQFNSPPIPNQQQQQQRRLSKQERILGMESSKENQQVPYQSQQSQGHGQEQRQLRGNGIIGRNYNPGMSNNHHHNNNNNNNNNNNSSSPEDGYDDEPYSSSNRPPPPPPKGYGGVEAYQDPRPRRGFSLKAARNWLDGRS